MFWLFFRVKSNESKTNPTHSPQYLITLLWATVSTSHWSSLIMYCMQTNLVARYLYAEKMGIEHHPRLYITILRKNCLQGVFMLKWLWWTKYTKNPFKICKNGFSLEKITWTFILDGVTYLLAKSIFKANSLIFLIDSQRELWIRECLVTSLIIECGNPFAW